ncbi:iron-siderophore ABC transporter substrate-binding protein [Patulibacter defluvii]|uniref:iron-siderophore ABC transporter substrate-binding protein n=1 Tax=Patulibacter defluvii TaxID=3095358 RepID=UPI002A755F57|nr:iron-siderophore ABC transporter substrate-binding protein [Patulibacter sp. DM4]
MRLPALLLAAVASVALAACGSDDPGSDTTTAPAAAGAFPVTVEHAFGKATIPKPPERVVTVGFNEHDFALALGVRPVAVREFIGAFPYKTRPWAPQAHADPAPALVGGQEIALERVAAARPDLILGIYSFVDEPTYRKLAKLAPTVAQGADAPPGGTPWDRQLLETGRALGREPRAKQIVAQVDGQFAAARERHPQFAGKTLTVAFEGGGSLFNLADSDLRQQFFTDLGFRTPKGAGIESISRERLDVLDQDVLVLITDDPKGLLEDPLFRRLDVVEEGRVVAVGAADAFAGALGFNSPLSRPYLLRQAEPRLAAALDGDPATKVAATE